MLGTNLATRPFYNVRLVRLLLGLAAVVLVAVSLLTFAQALGLRERERTLTARATEARQEAARLRAEAAQARSRVDLGEVQAISAAASEANQVIDKRAFSWGALLAQVETALPDDVRVTAVQPVIADEGITVTLTIETQSSESLSAFVSALERDGRFRNTLASAQHAADDDVIDAIVEGRYMPPDWRPAAEDDNGAERVEAAAP